MTNDNTNESDYTDVNSVGRRTFMKTIGAVGAGSLVATGGRTALAADGFDPAFANPRVREAKKVWERGYRGRPDRTIGLTDTGIDARHPDLGPWNGVTVTEEDGDLVLTTPESLENRSRSAVGDSGPYTGTADPGTFVEGSEQVVAEFTPPAAADELDAKLFWDPYQDNTNDLELRVDRQVDGEWVAVGRAASADMPEVIKGIPMAAGATYRYVIEQYLNTVCDYRVTGTFYEYEGTLETVPESAVFDFSSTGPQVKTVGWYDHSSRYGGYERPRDGNGHGTHCSSIMGGSGRASAISPDGLVQEQPHAVLTAGDTLRYEIDAPAGTGVFISAYGDAIELVIEGPDGQELDSSTVGLDDSSLVDNNVAESPTVHDAGTATYTLYVRAAGGETASTGQVDRVAAGRFVAPWETDGDRAGSGVSLHSGLAPDASLVGLQGLSGPVGVLADHADEFTSTFNLRSVNMSWSYVAPVPVVGGFLTPPYGMLGGQLTDLDATIKRMAEGGLLTVAAASNSFTAGQTSVPALADESVSVAATGPRDGITSYSSGGTIAQDEDGEGQYGKPDVTAPGGSLTDGADAAKNGQPETPEDEQPPIRDYTDKAGTSMASPYVNGIVGLVSEAMEFDAPASIALPEPAATGLDDLMRLKQAILATASETAFTAAPYHRAHTPTYDFGGHDIYEGYGRVNPDAAVDAVTRELSGTTSESVGLNVPDDSRAVAGYVQAGPGTVTASVSFDYYSGGNKGQTKGAPHVDLFVYDAENPGSHGTPNVVARTQGLQGNASTTASIPRDGGERTFYVVAKLVNVPGAVNGDDVQAHFDLSASVEEGFFVSGSRSDDGDAFTGGQTNQIDLAADPSADSEVRDVIPSEWTVLTDYSDDVARVEEDTDAGVKYVYFDSPAAADTEATYTYFAEAPTGLDHSTTYAFGPMEVDPGTGWVAVSGTSDTNAVVGVSTDT